MSLRVRFVFGLQQRGTYFTFIVFTQDRTTGYGFKCCHLLCYWGLTIYLDIEREVRYEEHKLPFSAWDNVIMYEGGNGSNKGDKSVEVKGVTKDYFLFDGWLYSKN